MSTNRKPIQRAIKSNTKCIALIAIAVAFLLSNNFLVHADVKPIKPVAVNDVRIVIDISGSMKKNDPENIRQTALKLFVSLLPYDTRSGVWTFGQWVNMLVPHGKVSKMWKKNANESIKKISSTGLYTNIEDALRQSTWDWTHTDNKMVKQSLIILTDGLVDISKNEQENISSRQRILQEILPLLQKLGVTIYAIALSEDSDRNLLEQLTSATGGQLRTMKTSEGLERLFLHIFDNVTTADSLPIIDNRVKVDDSISEITFLIFNSRQKNKISIISPKGNLYDIDNLDSEIAWHKEKNYDLVTIKNPITGYWKIDAPIDPDNRVMVVTDLKLISTKLPSTLLHGDNQSFYIHLEQSGKLIDRQDFLYFIKATINQTMINKNNEESFWKIKLLDNGKGIDKKAKDGIYSATLDKSLTAGEHEIEVVINGVTFRRYTRQKISIYSHPVTASIEKITDDKFKVSIFPYKNLIDPNTMQVNATHKTPDGKTIDSNIYKINPTEWMSEFSTQNMPDKHEVIINVEGNNKKGGTINISLPPLIINIIPSTHIQTRNVPIEGQHIENNKSQDMTLEKVNWVFVSLKVITINIFIFILMFAAYKYWPSLNRRIMPNLLEET